MIDEHSTKKEVLILLEYNSYSPRSEVTAYNYIVRNDERQEMRRDASFGLFPGLLGSA